MNIETEEYYRKSFPARAIRVTGDNQEAIAKWCKGTIVDEEFNREKTGRQFVKIDVQNPQNERQTKAFVGDWVVIVGNQFKVYTNPAFQRSFEKKPTQAPVPTPPPTGPSLVVVGDNGTAVTAQLPPGVSITKTKPEREDFRDAGTGKFVSEEYADANPGTTVKETD